MKRNFLDDNTIARDYKDGMSITAIAKKHSASLGGICKSLKRTTPNRKRWERREIKYPVNEHFFDDLSQEAPAYWLGFIYADGCIRRPSPNRWGTLTIGLAQKDVVHVEQFKACIGHRGPLVGFGDDAAGVRIHNETIYQTLLGYGLTPRKSLTLKFPTCVPDESMVHFLRGYVDGDGCLYIHKKDPSRKISIQILGTKDFLLETRQKLTGCISISDGSLHPIARIWRLQWQARQDCARIAQYLYGNCTIALDRKRDKAMEIINYVRRQSDGITRR